MAQYKKYSTIGKDENAPDPDTMAEVPLIVKQDQRQAIIANQRLVVIDNYTDWCGPCKVCAPQFAALAGKYARPGLCALVKENVEHNVPGVPTPIRGVPCFHFYVDGALQQNMTVTGGDIGAVEQAIQGFLKAVGHSQ